MPATPAKKAAKTAPKKAPAKKAVAAKKAAAPRAVRFPTEPPPAPTYDLGQKSGDDLHDLRVPSGALCQVRKPGVTGLIEAGVLDSVDQLTSLVQTEHIGPKMPGAATKAVKDFAAQPRQVAAGLDLVGKVVIWVVVQPKLYDPAACSAQELADHMAAGHVSVKKIDLLDQVFIMNWAVGGSADLRTFREEFQEFVGPLETLSSL